MAAFTQLNRENPPPERPAIPPLFYVATACIVALYLSLSCGIESWWPVALCSLVAGLLGVVYAHQSPQENGWVMAVAAALSLVFAGAALGCVFAQFELIRQSRGMEQMLAAGVSRCEFVCSSDAREGNFGLSCAAEVYCDGKRLGEVWLNLPKSTQGNLGLMRKGLEGEQGNPEEEQASPVLLGDRLQGSGRFESSGLESGSQDAWNTSLRTRGLCGTVRLSYVRERGDSSEQGGCWQLGLFSLLSPLYDYRKWSLSCMNELSGDGAVLARALMLNERGWLRLRGLDEIFSACGIAHLVAISGTHLSFLALALESLLIQLSCMPKARVVLVVGCSAAFVLLCGAPSSAVRAWIMSSMSLASGLYGRRADALSALSLAAIIICSVHPGAVGDIGFYLSLSCVATFSLYGSYVSYIAESIQPHSARILPSSLPKGIIRRMQKCLRASWKRAAMGMLALLASFPVLAIVFGSASLLSIPMNMLVSPLFILLFALSFLLLVLVCSSQALSYAGLGMAARCMSTLAKLCSLPLDLFCAACRRLCVVPVYRIIFPESLSAPMAWSVFGLVCAAWYLWWPQCKPRVFVQAGAMVALSAIAASLQWYFFAPARMIVLDVGQGDAILVQEGPHALLVDAGPPDYALARALQRNHVMQLDVVAITHLHDDHYGGLLKLGGVLPVRSAVFAEGVHPVRVPELAKALRILVGTNIEHMRCGDTLQIANFSLLCLAPFEAVGGSENAHSLQLLVLYEREGSTMSALLTGDAESEQLASILERADHASWRAALLGLDVLKVGHHGSEASLTLEQAQTLHPLLALVSAGKDNSYGHPTEVCRSYLEQAGARFLCTIDYGDLEVRPRASDLRLSVQRRP